MSSNPCAAAIAEAVSALTGVPASDIKVDAPPRYRFEDAQARDTANTVWWTQFGDKELGRLIGIALAESKDVLIAAARVEEYYGRYGVQRGQQFPQVGVQAQGGRQRQSLESNPLLKLIPGAPVTNDFYSLDLGVSFELDLWGRLRRATEAARADLLAVEENRRTVILTLVSAVASSGTSGLPASVRRPSWPDSLSPQQ